MKIPFPGAINNHGNGLNRSLVWVDTPCLMKNGIRLFVACLAMLAALPLAAEETPRNPVLAILRFDAAGFATGEATALEDLVVNAVVSCGEYRVVDRRKTDATMGEIELSNSAAGDVQSRQLAVGRMLAAQGLLYGSIAKADAGWICTLKLMKTETGMYVATGSDLFASKDEMALNIGNLALGLLEVRAYHRASGTAFTRATSPVPAAVRSLAGVWKADRGLDTVYIASDGTAIASLPSRKTVKLRVEASDGSVVITQDEPNFPALFEATVSTSIAVQLSKVARPMRWIFRPSYDGSELRGTKETTSFQYSGDSLESYDNSFSREAVWRRIRGE